MKNILGYIAGAVLSAAMVTLVSCRDDNAYISGNLVSLPDGEVRLYDFHDRLTAIDSTMSRDGRFAIRQPKTLPDLAFIGFEVFPDLLIPVILDGKQVYISGNLNYKDDITVSGTKANDDLRRYIASIRNIDIMVRAIELELDNIDIATDSVKYATMTHKRDSLRRLIDRSRAEFVSQNPSSIVSAMFLNMSMTDSMDYGQVRSLINRLDSTITDNAFSRRMQQRLEQLSN